MPLCSSAGERGTVLMAMVVKVTAMQEGSLAPEAEKTEAVLGNKTWPPAQHCILPTGCQTPCTASAPDEKVHAFAYHQEAGILEVPLDLYFVIILQETINHSCAIIFTI